MDRYTISPNPFSNGITESSLNIELDFDGRWVEYEEAMKEINNVQAPEGRTALSTRVRHFLNMFDKGADLEIFQDGRKWVPMGGDVPLAFVALVKDNCVRVKTISHIVEPKCPTCGSKNVMFKSQCDLSAIPYHVPRHEWQKVMSRLKLDRTLTVWCVDCASQDSTIEHADSNVVDDSVRLRFPAWFVPVVKT